MCHRSCHIHICISVIRATHVSVTCTTVLCRLLAGQWWLEYHRLLTAQEAEAQSAAGGKALSLPSGFAVGHELLKDAEREHCRCVCVSECVKL